MILIDKRGSGVSDHPTRGYIDPVDDAVDDMRAVLDEIGAETAILIGDTEGGSSPASPGWLAPTTTPSARPTV